MRLNVVIIFVTASITCDFNFRFLAEDIHYSLVNNSNILSVEKHKRI